MLRTFLCAILAISFVEKAKADESERLKDGVLAGLELCVQAMAGTGVEALAALENQNRRVPGAYSEFNQWTLDDGLVVWFGKRKPSSISPAHLICSAGRPSEDDKDGRADPEDRAIASIVTDSNGLQIGDAEFRVHEDKPAIGGRIKTLITCDLDVGPVIMSPSYSMRAGRAWIRLTQSTEEGLC